FTPDGSRAVLCGLGAVLVDTTGRRPSTSVGPAGRVHALAAFLPAAKGALLLGRDGDAETYNQKDGRTLRVPSPARPATYVETIEGIGPDMSPVRLPAVLSPNGAELFTYRPRTSELIRLSVAGGPRASRRVHGGDVLAISPDGGRLFVVGRNVIHVLD